MKRKASDSCQDIKSKVAMDELFKKMHQDSDEEDEIDELTATEQEEDSAIHGNQTSPAKKQMLSPVEFALLKQRLKQKQALVMTYPKILLNECGSKARIEEHVGHHCVSPLFVQDVQHLILAALLGDYSPFKPRWCRLERSHKFQQVVVVVVDGMPTEHDEENGSLVETLQSMFPMAIEVYSPKSYSSSVCEELLCAPISKTHLKKMAAAEHDLSKLKDVETVHDWFQSNAKITAARKKKMKMLGGKDQFPRTQLLLNPVQMLAENYPLPGKPSLTNDFVFTKGKYEPVTDSSPMYAVDCEMCMTTINKNELTRVSIVDEEMNLVYDAMVKPKNRIINYLTKYSGITAEMLRGVTTTFEDVQIKFRELLPPDAILVGQSLNSDLNALKLMHPYVIDTSVIFNLSGMRVIKPGLKMLSKLFLGLDIQGGNCGHSPIEDSASSLKLAQLKLSQDSVFGDVTMGWRNEFVQHVPGFVTENKTTLESPLSSSCISGYIESIYNILKPKKRTAAVIGSNSSLEKYSLKDSGLFDEAATACIAVNNKDDMKKKLKEEVKSHDFVLIHLNGDKVNPKQLTKFMNRVSKYMRDSSLLITLTAPETTSENDNILCTFKIKSEKVPHEHLLGVCNPSGARKRKQTSIA